MANLSMCDEFPYIDYFGKWRPRFIEWRKWGNIFDLDEGEDEFGDRFIVFRHPHTLEGFFEVDEKEDSQLEREAVFYKWSVSAMYKALQNSTTEQQLIEDFSFCVGKDRVRKFFKIYCLRKREEVDYRTTYRG